MSIERGTRIDLSSAGVTVAYAFGNPGSTPPTGTFTHIPGISEIPDLNSQPEMIDTTTLDELFERVGVPGLKALPSATGFTANFTQSIDTQWADVMEKYATNKAQGKTMWLAIIVPGIDDAFFFTCEPSPILPSGISVGSVVSTSVYITKTGEVIRAAAPTVAAWTAA